MEPRATTDTAPVTSPATTNPAPPRPSARAASALARPLPLVLGAATGALLCAATLGLATLLAPHAPDPSPIARALCDDLTGQRYSDAYLLLAPTLRAEGTPAQFIATQRQLDALRGRVTHCAYTITHADGASAVVTLSLTRGTTSTPSTATADVRLTRSGDNWLISAFDSALVRLPLRQVERVG